MNRQSDPLDQLIIVNNQYYVRASSSLADDRTRVLKEGETFAIFDRYGDIHPIRIGEPGLYHEGTRHLSRMEFLIEGVRPLLLNSNVQEDNDLLTVDLTNPDLVKEDQILAPHGAIHIFRSKYLWKGACYELLRFSNYDLGPTKLSFTIRFDADFADIFEVRGTQREQKGTQLATVQDLEGFTMAYEGLDGVVRRTRLTSDPLPAWVDGRQMGYQISLQPKEVASFHLCIACFKDSEEIRAVPFQAGLLAVNTSIKERRRRQSGIETSNNQFNAWLNRSYSDLSMMITETPNGPYPYAGVPWYSTPFGRDGIITAYETLWIDPGLAAGVLRHLAAHQAREHDPENDAEPGKILHESRKGEMAALGEIPFGCYYGSVDSTPLFVMLAAAYYERTGNRALIREIWPNIEAALNWITEYGDEDGDGFVEYARQSERGLIQQGWKDSHDSVFYEDGSLVEPPVALCEVQGYVYAALQGAAFLANSIGRKSRAKTLRERAEQLKKRFNEAFWSEEIGMYAIALDGRKRQCRVRTSNAGQCLFTGIADGDKARRTARNLMTEEMFSGWGIRTVGAREPRYNPMAYHNGSVWPHDNALIAAGFARYDLHEGVHKIMEAMFETSTHVELRRMPELYCGFHRRAGQGPALYPVACMPQAWATACVFLLIQSTLRMVIDGVNGRITFTHPKLPPFLHEVQIRNLTVGKASVDLMLHRYDRSCGVKVTRKKGNVEILLVK